MIIISASFCELLLCRQPFLVYMRLQPDPKSKKEALQKPPERSMCVREAIQHCEQETVHLCDEQKQQSDRRHSRLSFWL